MLFNFYKCIFCVSFFCALMAYEFVSGSDETLVNSYVTTILEENYFSTIVEVKVTSGEVESCDMDEHCTTHIRYGIFLHLDNGETIVMVTGSPKPVLQLQVGVLLYIEHYHYQYEVDKDGVCHDVHHFHLFDGETKAEIGWA